MHIYLGISIFHISDRNEVIFQLVKETIKFACIFYVQLFYMNRYVRINRALVMYFVINLSMRLKIFRENYIDILIRNALINAPGETEH